ncbi:MAG: peptide deformylase [Pelagibacteraceae bacterium]|jgi:peptide deformylase|nr:peptide deformylase [Pelagibacteraceae bacterium]|tara:strand:- start:4201 stop:4776 length:576 start_codon:yes stop_codon:yes gene_type:complete
MTIRKILTEPNKILREKSLRVENVNKDIQQLMGDMLETLYDAPGIGLAAIQVGVAKRVIVMDINRSRNDIGRDKEDINKKEDRESKKPMYFVNPEIIWKSEDKFSYEEGCLSLPNQFAEIDRPKQCHVKYLDYNGHPQELRADGLLATCIQHEIDHLEGILFIDYLSKLKKEMIIKKLSKQTKDNIERIVV